jgi:DNA helicase-2/ATP-dependent DNA helicase PcrA
MAYDDDQDGAARPEDSMAQERDALRATLDCVDANLALIDRRLRDYAREIQEMNDYMWEARRDMDHIDKIAQRQSIDQKARSAEILRAQRDKLTKLRASPYFGRVDFAREGEGEARPIYIGVHDFHDEIAGRNVVHDWRAPVSSMFYDHEPGPARYEAPSGEIAGRIDAKRQFRISGGRLELMFETGVQIVDDVLQEALGHASDDGMKTIVATIQRDQNAIIRDADAHTLIIQGVAGSGKTSIALHRIAFLLYRFKETLTSADILILSPNRVFADYIGNVLPELGEEQVGEIGMERLADELLGGKVKFQSFFEQTAALIEKDDENLKARIRAKAGEEFLKAIDAYVEHLEASSFEAAEWRASRRLIVPDWFLRETWARHRGMSTTARVAKVVEAAEHQIGLHYNHDLSVDERRSLRAAVRGMVRKQTPKQAWKGLFEWMGRPELHRPAGGRLEWADVWPFLYMVMKLDGLENPYADVKHLLIDEMQDYTPAQYAVIGRLFPCKKTILGDAAQSVNPYGASTAADIARVLRAAPPVTLTRSYRSTIEIMRFALAIAPNAALEPLERHGPAPTVAVCANAAEMTRRIAAEVADFETSDHRSLAVIAKTQAQAKALAKRLEAAGVGARLLDADSAGYSAGVMVCTAHMAKGLEFDRVVVADASAANYASAVDRNLLYVACTRAMHRLTVTVVGSPSPMLPAI